VRNSLKFIISLLIGAAFFYWFAHSLDWREVWQQNKEADLLLLFAATLVTISTYVIRSLRWKSFLAPIRETRFNNLFAATVIGFSGVFLIGRAGEIVRPVVCTMRERVPPSATFATIAIERVYDMVMVVIFFAVNMLFFNPGSSASLRDFQQVNEIGILLLLMAIAGILALIIFRLFSSSVISLMERRLTWLPKRLQNLIINMVTNLSVGLSVLQNLRGLSVTVGWSIALWICIVLVEYLIINAFSPNVPIGLTEAVFVMAFGLVGSLVPTPAGAAGAFHTAASLGLVMLGVEQNKAGSIAIAMHLITFGSAILLGVFYVIRDGISFGALKAMIKEDISPASSIRPTSVRPTSDVGR